jgi:hypothetical protein
VDDGRVMMLVYNSPVKSIRGITKSRMMRVTPPMAVEREAEVT